MDESDPTKLTSFKSLTPSQSSSGFSFSKWFDGIGRKKTSQAPQLPSTKEQVYGKSTETRERKISQTSALHICDKKDNVEREDFNSWLTKSISSQSKLFGGKEKAPEVKLTPEVVPRKEKGRYRNVRTILRRLSALTIDKRWHQTTGDFKDDFKQYWMPDEHCKECYECGGKFNTFRRRHHCRVCGQIFCYKCCNQEVHGKVIGFSGDIRVCNYCFKIVHAYLNDNFDRSIEALSEDIKACEPGYPYEFTGSSSSTISKSGKYLEEPTYRMKRSHSSNSVVSSVAAERAPTPTVQRSPFDMFGVAPSEANFIKQDYLRDLWKKIADPRNGLELQSHRYRLKMYQNCLVGNELTDWLLRQQKANSRAQAVGIGQDLLDNGWIDCVYPESVFKDEYMLYQPTKIALLETEAALIASPLVASVESDGNPIQQSFHERKNTREEDDDDPNWIKQMSAGKNVGEDDQMAGSSASHVRKFSTGRRLDLDLVTSDSTDTKKADLSLQMNLDSPKDDENNEIYDQTNKVSFITHVPPLPLDTYVCVDGYQSNVKKKVAKPNNNAIMSEDILRGVVFPRSNMEPEVHVEDHHEESGKMESGERIAMERSISSNDHHVHALLEQLLKQENLSEAWKEVILPFVFKVSEKVIPDVRRDDDMDIRRYVWINKVPGGMKTECHFVSGVVFRKNVAHKRMNDTFMQPAILMMSCAIEYQRVENKMSSLDPLVLQEYAFLQNFVKRVLALKPNVILVEKNVSRFAQDMLLAGGVTLVHNIKQIVMENIARCTGADILQTMEQVTRPRLGKCQEFRLQKFTLPNGKMKALMYINGCAPDLGCSLILRGGNEKTLIKVKKILEYLIYVSYQLKLEAKFLSDEFALPPPLEQQKTPSQCSEQSSIGLELKLDQADAAQSKTLQQTQEDVDGQVLSGIYGGEEEDRNSSVEEIINTPVVEESESVKFQQVLKTIILSSSPFCNYPMPYLLMEDGKKYPSRHFIAEKIYWSRYLDGSVSHPLKLVEDDHEWVVNEDHVNNEIIMKEAHPFTNPSELMDCVIKEGGMGTMLNDFRARGGRIDLKFFQEYEAREKRSVFGHYLKESFDEFDEVDRKSKDVVDDFPAENQNNMNFDSKLDCFDAFNHQKIAVLFSSYSSESKNAPKPCISPWAVYMEFYGRNDITLGGFLERYCFRPSYICPTANCDVPMVNHVRYFAHGSASLYIHMRNLESPIPGYDRTILTWSWCKICKQVTPVVPLSFESWAMSFAKYLELRFYGSQYTRRASVEPCGHSLHHDHYQYFSYANMVASFKYRAIDLHEVIIPSSKVVIGKQRNPKFLFNDVLELCNKVDSAINQIRDRMNEVMKSDEHTGPNAQRESRLKEFLTDLEKEHSNTHNVIQVIKLKTDNLSKTLSESPSSPSATSNNISSKQDQMNNKSISGGGESGGEYGRAGESGSTTLSTANADDFTDYIALHAEEHPMTDEDIHLLWVDITNKVFHLKKNICESVEHWNYKLQEFVTQDRKREKTSAAAPARPPTELSEVSALFSTNFYPDQSSVEMDPPQPKTITHMHPEPVSEVFLTNGTILRQTHYGTTPRESSPFLDSFGSDFPAKVRMCDVREVSENSTTEKLDIQMKGDVKETDGKDVVDGLPTPYATAGSQTLTDDNRKADSLINDLTTSQSLLPGDLSTNRKSYSVTSWIEVDKMDPVAVGDLSLKVGSNDETDASDNESLYVECDDDTGELTDNQSLIGDDDSNLPESECQSEVETAEEEDDDNGICLGQSAIDFEDKQKDKEQGNVRSNSNSTSISSPSTQSPIVTRNPKNRNVDAGGSAFKEFPKISDERIERIQYLTPNEVKAMQVARRRRNEWESRIRTVKEKKQQEKEHLRSLQRSPRPLPFSDDHFDSEVSTLPVEEKKEKKTTTATKTTATKTTATKTSTPTKKTERKTQQQQQQQQSQQSKTKGKFLSFSKTTETKQPKQLKKSTTTTLPKTRLMKGKVQSSATANNSKQMKNPLLKRLVQNTLDSSGEENPNETMEQRGKKLPIKKVDQENPVPKSGFVPVKGEIGRNTAPLVREKDPTANTLTEKVESSEKSSVEKDDTILSVPSGMKTPTKPTPIPKTCKSEMKSQTLNPVFNQQKRMGHRRMKSAPFRIATFHEESDLPSELTPESPFIFVSPVPAKEEMRLRSQSVGNRNSKYVRGQKELSRLAERVVHEDRLDAERDVPEVLQIDGNIMKSASAGQIADRSNSSPAMSFDGKIGNRRHPSGEMERKISDTVGVAPGKKSTKLGHTRQLSLSTRSASHDYDIADGKLAEGVPSKRGGSEKMKKIISQVFSSAAFQPIQRPFPPSEQYLPQVGGTSSIVINEREPTSLIAFTLSSKDYAIQLQNIQDLMAGKKVPTSRLAPNAPSSLISQPNSPNVPRRQILNIPTMEQQQQQQQQQRMVTPSPSPSVYTVSGVGGVVMRTTNNTPRMQSRPRSWAGTTDVISDADFLNKSNMPPIPDFPALKRVDGKRHPLSSAEFEPSTEVLIDADESSDDVMDCASSIRSDEPKKKEDGKATVDHHIKLQFQNTVAKFYCSVYYAEQFRQLREMIFPEGEERFIQSLARCKFWKATGGKSGSSFSKSYDDRFVMKQMSRLEVQSFVDFGPRYFAYINKAIKETRPTALAKLLGVYRIGFKNSVTNATMRQDVLVMENLFYEKKVNKIFDLKGSLRGRKVHMSTKEDVLMDENLLEMICDAPLFIRAHSKAVLSKAIHNDTEFLSTNMVMDYSLLVGIDETTMKLVVGIIDYIRTYTWDKKLESYVKSTGILGGAGKMPTVVSPDLYRTRFTEAMQRYFLMVPDKWTGFGNDLS